LIPLLREYYNYKADIYPNVVNSDGCSPLLFLPPLPFTFDLAPLLLNFTALGLKLRFLSGQVFIATLELITCECPSAGAKSATYSCARAGGTNRRPNNRPGRGTETATSECAFFSCTERL